ncbi:hypothetical protein IQ07DRAFT_585392 [Pyrenochaeta sp. DS3sAY3a]|nr:hypothetical protein IQ07DRAFT_585392 [Pyrenochaeta sp. DS3sAY3a]
MTSAQDRALHTPELLEAILLQLTPLHHLLHAQLISSSFHEAIRDSPRLQQRLFLRAQPRNPKDEKLTLNPLLRKHFLPFFLVPVNRFSMPDYSALQNLDWVSCPRQKAAFLRADASWRRMLIVQPPPRALRVVQFTHAMRADFKDEAHVSFADEAAQGVTMGAVYDIAESFLSSKVVAGFGLAIHSGTLGAGTQMTLHLTFTKQCCQRDVETGVSVRSAGATKGTGFWGLELEPVGDESGLGSRQSKRLWIDWETDLGSEDGLMELYEWEEWKRKKAPISDLVSDVRA